MTSVAGPTSPVNALHPEHLADRRRSGLANAVASAIASVAERPLAFASTTIHPHRGEGASRPCGP
jgi:hypothetical protein